MSIEKWSGGEQSKSHLARMSVGLRNLPTNETVTRPARRMCRSEESNLVRHTFLRPSSPAKLVLPKGIEPLTSAFEARHSVL